MANLKPCPFCGCFVDIYERKYPNGDTEIGFVGMHDEDCVMDRCFPGYESAEQAIDAWNRRAETEEV